MSASMTTGTNEVDRRSTSPKRISLGDPARFGKVLQVWQDLEDSCFTRLKTRGKLQEEEMKKWIFHEIGKILKI